MHSIIIITVPTTGDKDLRERVSLHSPGSWGKRGGGIAGSSDHSSRKKGDYNEELNSS